MKKPILFISHEASKTGAPILLLNFLKWFKHNTDIPFKILLRQGGELVSEFEALAPTERLDGNSLPLRIYRRFLPHKVFLSTMHRHSLNSLKTKIGQTNFQLIYSNTITNGRVLEFLANYNGSNCPFITHVHELECAICLNRNEFDSTKRYSDHYIAVSQAVKSNLMRNHGIPENKIDTVYGFVSTNLDKHSVSQESTNTIKNYLGISEQAFIVGSCGTLGWGKAPDLFIHLARAVIFRSRYPVHFVWVGGSSQSARFYELMYDIEKLGLSKKIHFVGAQQKPLSYFAAFDVFALVSREDSFPLVCLEAASLGKPIVCFDQAGGIQEFVTDGCGFVVPYLDIEAMSSKVLELLHSHELRQTLGTRASQKVREENDIEVGARRICKVINSFL